MMESILAKALGQDVSQMASEEKQQLLGRLLGRLAHEIRNPLSSLDIHVQLLEEDLVQAAPEIREKLTPRLEIIHGELHRLENIVKHFLRLSGPSALSLEPVALAEVAGHVCELLRPEATTREIDLRLDCPAALPVFTADPGQLTQALLNLVINSLQAVERRGRITMRLQSTSEHVVVGVHDSGPGIPADKLATIFEPYYTTKSDGTGLGLWIAQQIVTAHGGDLQAANVPSGGAMFTIRLPLREKGATRG